MHFRPYVPASPVLSSDPVQMSDELTLDGNEAPSGGRFQGSGGGDDEPLIDPVPASSRLLVIHQEKWQQELLIKYGELVLMDATYRTTCYDLALFFLVVHTNSGYVVVGEFCVQSEKNAEIAEALTIIKENTPLLHPKFFMTDYSEAEMLAIEKVFPEARIYLCDFHREQAWQRWTKNRNHGLNDDEASALLAALRSLAYAPPCRDEGQVPDNGGRGRGLRETISTMYLRTMELKRRTRFSSTNSSTPATGRRGR
ncbi:uncharacterized protein LOC135818812 [Sycon ciliatum]|uniref:uncharacterized protein LOC135818812 n=1 Tax=Sycon ciliatum TaxID=27933 RepID=UPI0031F6A97E